MPELLNHPPETIQADLSDRMVYPKSLWRPTIRTPQRQPAPATAWYRDRTLVTLALTALLILSIQVYRHQSSLTSGQYRLMRDRWHHNAATVLIGDSRTLYGVSPAIVTRHRPGPVLNYAFAGCQFNPDYYRKTQSILNPSAKQPTIIAGITPVNFFQDGMLDNPPAKPQTETHPRPLLASRPWFSYLTERWENPIETCHRDGWINRKALSDNLSEVERYRDITFPKNTISEAGIALFLDQVADWSRQGITVYGFRPPTCQAQLEVEANRCAFDYPGFIARFQAAGGIWLDVPQTAFKTFDGVHLTPDAALDFSDCLGRAINRQN